MGIALKTPVGTIVHTGDFKFDHTPVDGKLSDFAILAKLGAEGVICLLSDSTRAENPGYTPSERTVGEAFREIMEPLDGRVIVATFASNIARVQQVLDAAASMGRKVAVIGRSMEQNFRIATDLGYLKYEASQIVSKDKIKDHPDAKLVIATTGAQGEPMAGLARMANRDHRFVEIQPGDTVIVSASPIPGNEEYVSRTIDNLFKAGANVYYHTIKRAHVSGHASQEELKLMLGLTKPKYFIPIHGEFRMQVQHGRLATETGVEPENVFIIENGMPIELYADGSARRGAPVTAGYVFVDGLSVGDVGDIVLRDRRSLANDGMFMIVVTVDKQTGSVVGRPEIVTRGFVKLNEQDPLMEGRRRARDQGDRYARRPHRRARAPEVPDQGGRLALPVRADEAPAHGLSRRGRGLVLATRRRSSTTRSAKTGATRAPRRRKTNNFFGRVNPEVVRSILGTVMMALGAITLIALVLPGEGALTDWWRDSIAPWFEAGRWLLPFLLLAGGWWIAAGPGKKAGSGWGMTLGGLAIAYIAALGVFEILALDILGEERGGGRIGRFLGGTLEPLLTAPGAIVLLTAIGLLGLMLAFNLQLRQLVSPFTGTARWVGSTTAESLRRAQEARPTDAKALRRTARPRRRRRPRSRSPSPSRPRSSTTRHAASSTNRRHDPASRR